MLSMNIGMAVCINNPELVENNTLCRNYLRLKLRLAERLKFYIGLWLGSPFSLLIQALEVLRVS